jgi:hypothetical protein
LPNNINTLLSVIAQKIDWLAKIPETFKPFATSQPAN